MLPDSFKKDEVLKNLVSLDQLMDVGSPETEEYLEVLRDLGGTHSK